MPLVPHVASGQIVASTWGNLVADHVVMRFTTAAQRASQLTAPILNQLTSRDDLPGQIERWNGTAWVPLTTSRQLAHVEFNAQKTIAQGAEATADLVVSAGAITVDGGPVLIEFYSPAVAPAAAAGALIFVYLWQDGASIGRIATVANPAAGQHVAPVHTARRLTPAAGSRTFSIGATQAGGNGIVYAGAGGVGQYVPGFIRVTRAD